MKDQRRFAPITGRLELEWMAGFKRNRRPTSSGLHGRLHRNAHYLKSFHLPSSFLVGIGMDGFYGFLARGCLGSPAFS